MNKKNLKSKVDSLDLRNLPLTEYYETLPTATRTITSAPKDELLEELKDCLDYHDDFEYYGNGEEEEHVEFFKENFDKIIKGEMELPDDPGLLATIAENMKSERSGLVNKTKEN